ncbi:zinc/manganese /iron transport system permease protein [Dehalogenimonas formicexedens]|uniref:Zinc/manganese /iron transport system permease protein n=1 Tax=Dehalogenimonas formicexedens TaxID=1839801 RepID=A0A1P8F4W4_9CHLR|nr:metal ABC transporter permease [Dehalogenimonas formicexedens]APV43527.1 zinc/manganese /iron transport system permease protein [Dehalogenimonas formicexedens]
MIDFFIGPFANNEFMIKALVAGILVSVVCAIAGTFIVLRGLAFIGDALAHGVLPGIAAAVLFGFPGIIGATVGAAVMIGGVTLITQRSRLSSDTAIGLLFVSMLALGVAIVSRSGSFSGDLTRILFGELLGISWSNIWLLLASAIIIGIVAIVSARPFMLLAFDPEQAQVAGFSARKYHFLMLVMIAATVIVSFQTVGTLLVFGLLIAPAGAGALLASRIGTMMALATIFGAFSMFTGLLVSYHLNIAAGASVILVAAAIFFTVFVVKNVSARRAPGVSEGAHG